MAAVVQARGLTKRYGDKTVVDGIDLTIKAGECFGLLGPNGAGKTTILKMLMGNTPISAGELQVLGLSIPAQARKMRERLGIVPQFDNLDPDFSVSENLRTYGSFFGIKSKVMAERIPRLLEFAALELKADASISALSGGMQRRLTMARALVNDPELIILDEPTTGLDPQARQLIWRRLRDLLSKGKTLVLTTHYMDEAERLCDRIAIIDNGKIIVEDSPAELIRQHIEPQVIEVYGPGLDAWGHEDGEALADRVELIGETLFCYCKDDKPLLASLAAHSSLKFLHRRANMEDVFLKLTGKELRD